MTSTPDNIATDCIDKHAASPHHREKTALIAVDASGKASCFTFAELEKLTNQCAATLRDQGAVPGERLVIRLPNTVDFPIGFLGAIKAGLIPIPTSPLLTENELNFVLEDSGASHIFEVDGVGGSGRAPTRAHGLEHGWAEPETGPAPMSATSSNSPAYWLYTSGTEGRPKGVIHSHRSIPAHDERVKMWLDLREDDIVFNTSALNWSYALTAMLDVWRHGGTFVIYDGPMDPESLWRIITEQKVTILMSVPGIYRRLAKIPPGGFVLRRALSAGEALAPEVRDQFRKVTGLEILGGLGMTEHSVYLVQSEMEAKVGSHAARPLSGHRIAILCEDLTDAPVGEVGVLASHRSCPGLMLGYHNRPEEEARVFQGDWFLSDDLAQRNADGTITFLGRRDDVITAGGYRISPLEVEAVLNQYPGVAESAVVGRELEPGKTILQAWIVPKEGGTCDSEGVIAHCRKFLAHYKLPREIRVMASLPKTATGKIKRAELRWKK